MESIAGVISESRNAGISVLSTVLLLVAQFFAVGPCLADYQIVDSNGLVRAVKVTDQPVHLRIQLSVPQVDISSVVLKHIDGVTPDLQPMLEAEGRLHFLVSQSGTWQIRNLSPKHIKTVEISE